MGLKGLCVKNLRFDKLGGLSHDSARKGAGSWRLEEETYAERFEVYYPDVPHPLSGFWTESKPGPGVS
jgi:hypothetical protein